MLSPSKQQIKYVPPVVVPDDSISIESNLPKTKNLKRKLIGIVTHDSTSEHHHEGLPVDVATIDEVIAKENQTEIFNTNMAHQQSEFPYGITAMYIILRKHFKYPNLTKEHGINETVYVPFVLSEDGLISNAEVVRGIGGGLDAEALRIVNLMPLWNLVNIMENLFLSFSFYPLNLRSYDA